MEKDMDIGGTVERWHPHEVELVDARGYADPYHDAELRADLCSPSGVVVSVPGFWDGGSVWRLRFCPGEVGRWQWRSVCSDPGNDGLHGREGAFLCEPGVPGDNPLYRHGPVTPVAGRWHFAHADGTPFFWLGDTAWNAVLRAKAADWSRYLDLRRKQGFTVIDHFSTTWRGLPTAPCGVPSFEPGPPVRVHPEVFRPMDERVLEINRRGLLAAPLLVIALYDDDPGWALPEGEVARLARYVMARWGAYHVAWSLGGDGDFSGSRAKRWRRVGRAVAADTGGRPMTMHPCGLAWNADEFRDEAWFSFIAYQSCHFAATEARAWPITGPLRGEWRKAPPRPIINLEPNYEGHPALDTGEVFADRDVRVAVYRSLLLAPPCGVTYGNFHVWSWSDEPEDRSGTLPGRSSAWRAIGPWHAHLETPGALQVGMARRILESGPWTELRPAPEVLAGGADVADPARYVSVASTADQSWILAHIPPGVRDVTLAAMPGASAHAQWIDPRTGRLQPAVSSGGTLPVPAGDDWLLDVRR
jgi:hypothetical protein